MATGCEHRPTAVLVEIVEGMWNRLVTTAEKGYFDTAPGPKGEVSEAEASRTVLACFSFPFCEELRRRGIETPFDPYHRDL